MEVVSASISTFCATCKNVFTVAGPVADEIFAHRKANAAEWRLVAGSDEAERALVRREGILCSACLIKALANGAKSQ